MNTCSVLAGLLIVVSGLDVCGVQRADEADSVTCAESVATSGGPPTRVEALRNKPRAHIPFIRNQGQQDGDVEFYAQMFAGTVFVTRAGDIVYHLPGATSGTGATGLNLA